MAKVQEATPKSSIPGQWPCPQQKKWADAYDAKQKAAKK